MCLLTVAAGLAKGTKIHTHNVGSVFCLLLLDDVSSSPFPPNTLVDIVTQAAV